MSHTYEQLYLQAKRFALEDRAQFVNRHIGESAVPYNQQLLREAILRCTRDPETGELLSIQAFEKRIFDLFSIVFTGHPVWNMTPAEYEAFSRRVNAPLEDDAGLSAKKMLEQAAHERFVHPDLDRENEDTYQALFYANQALRLAEEVAIEVGQEVYPESWTQINYTVGLLYKWTLHDWDGREDINWNLPFADKMRLQFEKFRHETIPDFLELKALLSNPAALEQVDAIVRKLDFSAAVMEKHYAFYKHYNVDLDEGLVALQQDEIELLATKKDRITHPRELIAALNEILESTAASNTVLQKKVVQLRTAINGRGLSLSRTHSRINSTNIESTHTKDLPDHEETKDEIDQGVIPNGVEIPDEDKPTLDERYLPKLNHQIKIIKQAPHRDFSLLDLALSQHSVGKQILVSKMTGELINEQEQSVHLIADHRAAFHSVGLLSFIYKYGAEKFAFPVGLWEEEIGLKNDNLIIYNLLTNVHFQSFVQENFGNSTFPYHRVMQQGGFSDLMRQYGLFASAFTGRTGERFLNAVANVFDGTVGYVYFPTGGNKDMRGYHLGSYKRSLEKRINGHSLARAQKKGLGWAYSPQLSFQGQDAFLLFSSVKNAFAILTQSIDHVTRDHSAYLHDPWFRKHKDTMALTESVKNASKAFNANPDWIDLLFVFKNLNARTGSRPPKRKSNNKRLRAIGQANIMETLEFPAPIVVGFNKAANDNPRIFEKRMQESPHFVEAFIEVMDIALDMFDPGIGHRYLELLNPNYWEAKSVAHPEKREVYRRIADTLTKYGNYYRFKPIGNLISREFEDAKALRRRFDDLIPPFAYSAYQPCSERRAWKNRIHETRLALMESLWEKMFSIKKFGRKEVSVEEAYAKIVRFEQEGIDIIDGQFRVSARQVRPIDERYRRFAQNGEDIQYLGYADIQETIESARQDLQKIKDLSVILMHLNYGTG
jgi:hypothetical protein